MRCRACMQIGIEEIAVDMSNVVEGDSKTFYDYFNECTQLQATSTDNLPMLLCMNCSENLRVAYNFRKEAINSDKELKKLWKLQEVEPLQTTSNSEQLEILDDIEESINDPLIVPESVEVQSENKTYLEGEYKMNINYIKKELSDESSDIYWDKDSFVSDYTDSTNDEKYVSTLPLLFECTLCDSKFPTEDSYRTHVLGCHKGSLNVNDGFECEHCETYFPSAQEFAEHQKGNHKEKSSDERYFKNKHKQMLSQNDKKSRTQSTYVARRGTRTENKRKQIEANSKILSHLEVDTKEIWNENLVACSIGNKNLPSTKISSHESHVHRLKKKEKYICSLCPLEFASEATVKEHEKRVHLHKKRELKECPTCHKKLDPKVLNTHIKSVHTERNFVCDICDNTYKTKGQLSDHKRLHLDRKFACTLCPTKFARANDLKVHMRIHTGETPFACHLCERRFIAKGHLTYHLQKHAGVKKKCKECGKEFNDIRYFKVHSYKHTGMPYRCTICNYGCAPRAVFKKHLLRVHNMTMTPAEYCAMFKANTGRNPVVRTVEELQLEAKDGVTSE